MTMTLKWLPLRPNKFQLYLEMAEYIYELIYTYIANLWIREYTETREYTEFVFLIFQYINTIISKTCNELVLYYNFKILKYKSKIVNYY